MSGAGRAGCIAAAVFAALFLVLAGLWLGQRRSTVVDLDRITVQAEAELQRLGPVHEEDRRLEARIAELRRTLAAAGVSEQPELPAPPRIAAPRAAPETIGRPQSSAFVPTPHDIRHRIDYLDALNSAIQHGRMREARLGKKAELIESLEGLLAETESGASP